MVLKIDIDEIRPPISAMLKLELANFLSEYLMGSVHSNHLGPHSLNALSNLEEKADEDKVIVFISSMPPYQ